MPMVCDGVCCCHRMAMLPRTSICPCPLAELGVKSVAAARILSGLPECPTATSPGLTPCMCNAVPGCYVLSAPTCDRSPIGRNACSTPVISAP